MWSLDLRSLALVRILYGLLLLSDILIRATDLVAHYTDWGLAPRSAVLQFSTDPVNFSLHMIGGTWPFEAVLFTIGAMASVCLTVGYQTRWAGWIAWVHLISMHTRNPWVLDGGDIYLRSAMFWLLFTPWGARWSIDGWRSPAAADPVERSVFSLASMCYAIQVSLVYVFAALLKTSPEWRIDFTATYYALMIEQLTTPLAAYMLPHPELMKHLTVLVWWFEALGPILLWLPGPFRMLGVVGISLMHLAFGSFLHLAIFALIGASSPLGMVPGGVWDRLEKIRLWARFQELGRRLASSWPFPGRASTKAPYPQPATDIVLAILMIHVALWNLADLPGVHLPFPRPERLVSMLRLDQKWNMFAPRPLDEDGWYVIETELVDGTKVDLYREGAPVSFEKPIRIAPTYPNARWRKFMMNIWSRDNSDWRLYYGRYLTRKWNSVHSGGKLARKFTIYFMMHRTLLNGQRSDLQKVPIWNHHCFDTPEPTPTVTPTPVVAPTPGVTPTPP